MAGYDAIKSVLRGNDPPRDPSAEYDLSVHPEVALAAGGPGLESARSGSEFKQVVDPPPEEPRRSGHPWSTMDKGLQAAFTLAALTDVAQTMSSAANGWKLPDGSPAREDNPILGRNPSPGKLALLGGGAIAGHALVSHLLPDPYRTMWQIGGLGAEALMVGNNHRLGARVNLTKLW